MGLLSLSSVCSILCFSSGWLTPGHHLVEPRCYLPGLQHPQGWVEALLAPLSGNPALHPAMELYRPHCPCPSLTQPSVWAESNSPLTRLHVVKRLS